MPPSPTSPPPPSSPSPIAAAMGFSSFGSRPNPPKKRKLHQSSTKQGHQDEGTGGNSIPLGRRRHDGGQYGGGAGNAGGTEGGRDRGLEEGDGEDEVEEDDGESELQEARGAALARLGLGAAASPVCPVGPPTASPRENAGNAAAAGKDAQGRWDWRALARGVRDENGDLAFYDKGFVEDPWRHLLGSGVGE